MKQELNKYRGIFPAVYACYDESGAVSAERTRALAEYFIGKEYENEIAALQHRQMEEQSLILAAMENEKEKLVVMGSGVRLPDSMSAEALEAMLSETEVRENA